MSTLATKSTSSTLSTPLDSGRAAKIITELYDDAQSGMKRVVALGLFCIGFKAQLAHGKFQQWIAEHCPNVTYRTIAQYMELTHGVFETHAVKALAFGADLQKCNAFHFSHPGEFLLAETAHVPDQFRPLHKAILADLTGQSRRQLTFKLKSNNMLGGFHPNNAVVAKWLKANHPDIFKSFSSSSSSSSSVYPWLLEHHPDLAAAYRKQHKVEPIPADVLLQAKRDHFDRLLNSVAQSLDDKEYAHITAERRRDAMALFRDYFKALSASLKGQKKKGQGK